MTTRTRTCWYDYGRVGAGEPVAPCDSDGVWRVRPDRLALAELDDALYACTTHLGAAVARYEDVLGCGVHVDRWA